MFSKRAQSKADDRAGAAAKARQDLEEARRSSAAHGPLVFGSVLSQQRKADGSIDVRLEDQDWYRTYTVDVNVLDPLPWKSTIAVLAWNEPFRGRPGEIVSATVDDGAIRFEAEGEGWSASWGIPQGEWITPAVGSHVSLAVNPERCPHD